MFTYTLTTVVKNIESLSRGSSKKTIKRKKKKVKEENLIKKNISW